MKYTLPPLPYEFDALEPIISARALEIHYSKHHQAYTDGFNKALEKTPEPYRSMEPDILLRHLDQLPASERTPLQNFGGGYVNHTFFWSCMCAENNDTPPAPLYDALIQSFGSLEHCKQEFSQAAKTLFGSGWAWLVADKKGKLDIIQMANQDSPLTIGLMPLLTLDVWEHAYYLDYQNRRAEFIERWWQLVNWSFVVQEYAKVTV